MNKVECNYCENEIDKKMGFWISNKKPQLSFCSKQCAIDYFDLEYIDCDDEDCELADKRHKERKDNNA